MAKIICVVVTYNATKWITKCFGSLRGSEYPIKTIVVDNGSTDGTIEVLEKDFPEVSIMKPKGNLGFGKGNNVGIDRALQEGCDFVFLLNQDAYLHQGSLRSVLDIFNGDPRVGLVSPIHLAGDQRNLDFGFYKYVDPRDTPFFLGDFVRGDLKSAYETKFVNAAAWVLRGDMLKEIGTFHPVFDHYGEDREYISRMIRAGYKPLICSSFFIVHDRPQKRAGNEYHKYGQTVKRDMLQHLIEKSLTYNQVSYRMLKLALQNLMSLRVGYASAMLKGWIWVTKKRREI